MIKLIKNKKFLLLSCGLLLAFLFLFKTPSLAQTPTVCPGVSKPFGLAFYDHVTYWTGIWINNRAHGISGYVHKTSGASPATGMCYSDWDAQLTYAWQIETKTMFCGCNNVGFKAYNQKPGCPEVESDEVKVNFGGCICARADLNNDNAVDTTDHNTFNSLYTDCRNCTPWTCDWSTCGKADLDRDGKINDMDDAFFRLCYGSTFCWCGTKPASDIPAYVCKGPYYGKPQCKAKAVVQPQGACVLDPGRGADVKNPSSSTNQWKWMYCYPRSTVTSIPSPVATVPFQGDCKGLYFGKSQCKVRVTPEPGYSCQLNPSKEINPSNPSDPINDWKWSYCKN